MSVTWTQYVAFCASEFVEGMSWDPPVISGQAKWRNKIFGWSVYYILFCNLGFPWILSNTTTTTKFRLHLLTYNSTSYKPPFGETSVLSCRLINKKELPTIASNKLQVHSPSTFQPSKAESPPFTAPFFSRSFFNKMYSNLKINQHFEKNMPQENLSLLREMIKIMVIHWFQPTGNAV